MLLVLTTTGLAQDARALDTVRPPVETAVPAAPPARADDRPISHLFQNLVGDLKHVPSKDSLVTSMVDVPLTFSAHDGDHSADRWAREAGPSGYARFGNRLGNGYVQGAAAIGVWAAGALTDHPGLAHTGSDLIRAQVLNGLLTTTVKYAVNRTRPTGASHAFPSGHTSSAFATATVLAAHANRPTAIGGYALAVFVAWSRVRSDQHWLSDITAAAAFGIIAGRAVVRGHPRRWSVLPAKVPGGAAVLVVRAR